MAGGPELTPRERLRRALAREKVDRPPVICPGGMMNAAVTEVAARPEASLPESHFEAAKMAALALRVARETGFENLAAPFCMTVEAEALGSPVNPGDLACEPKIVVEPYKSAEEAPEWDLEALLAAGRVPVVLEALGRLAEAGTDLPVIVSLSGPVSVAASVVDPLRLFREMRRNKPAVHRLLERVTEFLAAYVRRAAAAGAEAAVIADPSATGDILGPALFEEFAAPYLRAVVRAAQEAGTPAIVHICGDTGKYVGLWPSLEAEAVSVDAVVNLPRLKRALPDLAVMGNVSAYLLEFGQPEKITAQTRALAAAGVDVLAPACGLSTSTSLKAIRAMTGAV